ncbi:MAG: alanine--tRNA ligase [Candidatus Methanomethylicia archaeon]
MMVNKEGLREYFSRNWDKYYRVDFLVDLGFKRRTCVKCGRGFWTIDENRNVCPDQPCSYYEFIGNSPTSIRLDYVGVWKAIEDFFVKHGHESIGRYPVVSRWYPPLFFTAASIVDFYRLEDGTVVFEFPANPLIIPQFCLRFNDISNVGVTGKHYTCFVMIGQHSLYNGREGYWKDRCIELDYKMLTEVFKIRPEEVVFLEDLWVGTGAFGYSLEYFIRGLELGNAVFTEFLIAPDGFKHMPYKVVDMGAGLERFPWLLHGTPTSYDVVFQPTLERLKDMCGVRIDEKLLLDYYRLAGMLNIDEVKDISTIRKIIAENLGSNYGELLKVIEPLQALYSICDHTRTLAFAIADGMIPSNIGGGYNLRVVLRRALSFIESFNWSFQLIDVVEMHAKQLKPLAPELEEHLNEIQEILDVETSRFKAAKDRATRVIDRIAKSGKLLDTKTLIMLYESEGITPELVRMKIPNIEIPPDFYNMITRRNEPLRHEETKQIPVEGIPATRNLFYEYPYSYDFDAKIIKIIGEYIVLDQTLFYPTAGGQLHDEGLINGKRVFEVVKIGNVILHRVENPLSFSEGVTVHGVIDRERREALRRHHTATHIVNAASRMVLGSWVWQHGAEKTPEKARLDITHYQALTDNQIKRIEEAANQIVLENYPVIIQTIPRREAELKYGFIIYQGGAVPSREVRIVEIPGVDVEACGGIHCKSTGEVGFITIMRTKRIQDGIVRIEFCSGKAAIKYLEDKWSILRRAAEILNVPDEDVPRRVEEIFNEWKMLKKKFKR